MSLYSQKLNRNLTQTTSYKEDRNKLEIEGNHEKRQILMVVFLKGKKRPANEQIPTAVKSDMTPDIRVIFLKF